MPAALPTILFLTVVLLVTGCETRPPQPETTGALPPLPPLITEGARIYQVQPDQSEVRILVYRGGMMAALGHNHIVASNQLNGRIYLHDDLEKTGFELTLPVDSLNVDRPELRRQEGADFSADISPQSITGTHRNMLGEKVLNAGNFPTIHIRSAAVSGTPENPKLTARFTLRGVSRDLLVPLRVQYDGKKLTASGEMEIAQAVFGITPYSVMAGALIVQNELKVKYRVVALRKAAD